MTLSYNKHFSALDIKEHIYRRVHSEEKYKALYIVHMKIEKKGVHINACILKELIKEGVFDYKNGGKLLFYNKNGDLYAKELLSNSELKVDKKFIEQGEIDKTFSFVFDTSMLNNLHLNAKTINHYSFISVNNGIVGYNLCNKYINTMVEVK